MPFKLISYIDAGLAGAVFKGKTSEGKIAAIKLFYDAPLEAAQEEFRILEGLKDVEGVPDPLEFYGWTEEPIDFSRFRLDDGRFGGSRRGLYMGRRFGYAMQFVNGGDVCHFSYDQIQQKSWPYDHRRSLPDVHTKFLEKLVAIVKGVVDAGFDIPSDVKLRAQGTTYNRTKPFLVNFGRPHSSERSYEERLEHGLMLIKQVAEKSCHDKHFDPRAHLLKLRAPVKDIIIDLSRDEIPLKDLESLVRRAKVVIEGGPEHPLATRREVFLTDRALSGFNGGGENTFSEYALRVIEYGESSQGENNPEEIILETIQRVKKR